MPTHVDGQCVVLPTAAQSLIGCLANVAMQQQMLSKFYTDMLADVAGSTLMMWVVKRDVECSCWQGSLDRLPGHDAEDGPCDVQQGFLVVVRPY